jgi:D-arabinose 5-phosphate isomerase GutQ
MMQNSEVEILAKARDIIKAEAKAVDALADQIDHRLVEVVGILLKCKGHILVAGAGTSHAVAQRFAHLLSCSGTPALCIDAGDALHGGAGAITDSDVVYVISKGGQSEEVNRFAQIAKARGAQLVAQTENVTSTLAKISDAVLPVITHGDVDPYGMVATGSSLVNSAAGDMLCVLLLEMRGYTKDAFAETHPGGAVGIKIQNEKSR